MRRFPRQLGSARFTDTRFLDEAVQFSKNNRVAGCRSQCRVGQLHQFSSVKGCSQAADPLRSHDPVAVASRAGKQVDVMREALAEG